MTIIYHPELEQGSDEWKNVRCGLLTASEIKLIMTPTYKISDNDKDRAHLYKLVHQRVTRYVPSHYVSNDMLRGKDDEIEARILYEKHFAPVTDMGFITDDMWGFTIGYSPDGLVGDDGLIECKSRREDLQTQFIIEQFMEGVVPPEYILQIQTGLMITRRAWCDFVSYSNGEPMTVTRVEPDYDLQGKIVAAATSFEKRASEKMAKYKSVTASGLRMIPTERRIIQEMFA